jgi:hypothetical protein
MHPANLFRQLLILLTTLAFRPFEPEIVAALGYLHHPAQH